METVPMDIQDLEDMKDTETRLDKAIETAKGYLSPDEASTYMNDAVLKILLFIKTGKSPYD